MLEKCLQLDPTFTKAYIELAKLTPNILRGPYYQKAIALEPYDWEHYVRYAQWLESNSKHKKNFFSFYIFIHALIAI